MRSPYVLHLPKWYPNDTDSLEGIFVKRHVWCTDPFFKSVVLYIRAADLKTSNTFYYVKHFAESNTVEYKIYYRKHITRIRLLDKWIKLILFCYLTAKFLRKILREHGRPGLTIVHVLLRNSFVAYFLKLFYHIPYIIIEHSTFYLQDKFETSEKFKNLVRSWAIRKADYLIAVSKNLLSKLHSLAAIHPPSCQIFNTVDTELFHERERSPNPVFRVLHVSEFNNEHKNVSGIIEAIKRLSKNPQPVQLNLVGYGRDTEKIMQQITTSGCEQSILYKGKLEGPDLAMEYSMADLFVLFSNKENMPCVIAEALCCGTPVLSTDVGGISEILNSENGILIEKANIDALTDALAKCANGELNFDRHHIAQQARQLFSTNSVADRLKEIYVTLAPVLVK